MKWLRRKRLHDCWVPRGAVFSPLWACPERGDKWRLVEYANRSEWVREERD